MMSPESSRRARADQILRCVKLTVTAELAYAVDPSGWLSAQLLDLRDLLEADDREERWSA